MRKELDKLKAKLKDTDSKLKNAVQDKIKLEVFIFKSELFLFILVIDMLVLWPI